MTVQQHDIQHCRWSGQTMFLADPFWLAATDFPWTCHREGYPRPIDDTRVCRTCGRWEPRENEPEPIEA